MWVAPSTVYQYLRTGRPKRSAAVLLQQSQQRYYNSGNHGQGQHRRSEQKTSSVAGTIGAGVGAGLLLAGYLGLEKSKRQAYCLSLVKSPRPFSSTGFDKAIEGLPTYRLEEIAKHHNEASRIWVSYKSGVYDITDFVSLHPGGDRILMAAGSCLETFWELFPIHQKDEVFKVLAKYRIGNVHPDDIENAKSQLRSMADTFAGEPARNSLFRVRSVKPYNGETPPNLLTAKFYTPNDLFYVRNHLPVPSVDLSSYALEVEGKSIKKGKDFTLSDVKKLPKHEVTATIQCGGNRRSEMGDVKPVQGLAWSGGAIGNARWGGAKLIDVLKLSGFDWKNYPNPEKYHIQFEGLDMDPSGEPYGASIPLSYLKDDNFEAVLAYEMNGSEIPVDHGYPLRAIVPGIVGARNVKWLGKIVISDQESQSPWQQRDYKVFSPSVTLETVDYNSSPAIQDTPVTCYSCSHEDGQVLPQGSTCLEGYAFSGGGRGIIRVEVSTDEGKSWRAVEIFAKEEQNHVKNWSWVLWKCPLQFSCSGKYPVWVRAVDTGYNHQAESLSSVWNYRGLLANAYHKITFTVK